MGPCASPKNFNMLYFSVRCRLCVNQKTCAEGGVSCRFRNALLCVQSRWQHASCGRGLLYNPLDSTQQVRSLFSLPLSRFPRQQSVPCLLCTGQPVLGHCPLRCPRRLPRAVCLEFTDLDVAVGWPRPRSRPGCPPNSTTVCVRFRERAEPGRSGVGGLWGGVDSFVGGGSQR